MAATTIQMNVMMMIVNCSASLLNILNNNIHSINTTIAAATAHNIESIALMKYILLIENIRSLLF